MGRAEHVNRAVRQSGASLKHHRALGMGAVALGLLVAVPAVGAPVSDGSSWIPVATGADMPRIAAFDVRADRGIVILDTHRAGGVRFAVATFRRSGTGAVRTGVGTLGLGPTVVYDVVSDRRGGWLVLSHPTDASAASRVTRIGVDGRVDRSYGESGSTVFNAQSNAIAVDEAGRAWVVGTRLVDYRAGDTVSMTRIARNGALDTAFGPRGTATIMVPVGGAASRLGMDPAAVVVHPSSVDVTRAGQVVLSGTMNTTYTSPATGSLGFLARLDRMGALDPTFGSGGVDVFGPVRPVVGASSGYYGQGLSIEPIFGNISVSGIPAGDSKTVVWKRTARGLRNGSFVNRGWLRLSTLNQTSRLGATCNGGVWAVETSTIQVYTRTGRPDRRFAPGGRMSLRGGAQLRRAHESAYDPVSCRVTVAQIGARGRTAGIVVGSFATPKR